VSTALHDLASSADYATGLYPDAYTSSPTGPTVDLIAADGPCFAVQVVGAFAADSLAGRVEQSADGTTWAAVPGAAFAAVTAGFDTQVIRFARSARYVRYAATLAGTSPSADVAAVIGEQKKTI
jgi:hypothetical protein